MSCVILMYKNKIQHVYIFFILKSKIKLPIQSNGSKTVPFFKKINDIISTYFIFLVVMVTEIKLDHFLKREKV